MKLELKVMIFNQKENDRNKTKYRHSRIKIDLLQR